MTELELYRYLQDVEVHILHKGARMENMDNLTEDNWEDWKVLIFPYFDQLKEFADLVGVSFFDDGLHVVLKCGYVVIDLFSIIQHYELEPKNIFK